MLPSVSHNSFELTHLSYDDPVDTVAHSVLSCPMFVAFAHSIHPTERFRPSLLSPMPGRYRRVSSLSSRSLSFFRCKSGAHPLSFQILARFFAKTPGVAPERFAQFSSFGSLALKSFRIRTYRNRPAKSSRIRTYGETRGEGARYVNRGCAATSFRDQSHPAIVYAPRRCSSMHLGSVFARPVLTAAVLAAATLAFASITAHPAAAATDERHSQSWSTHHDGPAAGCSDMDVRFNHDRALVQSEEKTLTRAEAPTLRVHAETNGGVQIQGWDKDTYSVTTCKFAEPPQGEADVVFSQIHTTISGGEVSASGPGHRDRWSVFFLIRTPRGAVVNLDATNGPLSTYSFNGKLTARATNGPISLHEFSGEGDVEAVNGPISINGSHGNLSVRTQNGPISVNVSESKWDGAGLTASAENGPVSLHVPDGFQSAFLVESRGHGPVSCHASICGEARKTWDDEDRRKIEYGSGSPMIKLSSYNGPVSVR